MALKIIDKNTDFSTVNYRVDASMRNDRSKRKQKKKVIMVDA